MPRLQRGASLPYEDRGYARDAVESSGLVHFVENLNNIIDTGLPYRRARSNGAQGVTFDLLAQAFTINSVARFRAAKRIASVAKGPLLQAEISTREDLRRARKGYLRGAKR